MSLKKNSKGFTLIELMIVVAIIGILAAVAVPKFADLVTKSKEASVKGALGSVRSALSIYYGDTEGVYPDNVYVALCNDGAGTTNKYMPAVASQPSLGRFEIPSNTKGNTNGHTGNLFKNASSGGAVRYDAAAAASEGTESLVYGTGANTKGEIYVNCTHNDTKVAIWTSY